jgi:hypothetical protein
MTPRAVLLQGDARALPLATLALARRRTVQAGLR